jgi:hypothetical protein
MSYGLKIKRLDIQESYFAGDAELDDVKYKINIQHEGSLGKAILFPFPKPKKQKILVRLSGPDKYVEEYLTYGGKSEWIEIDSNSITDYIADNQDKFNYIEIYPNPDE